MDLYRFPPPRIDVYTIVTEQIISLLEQGVVPWKQPWTEAGPPMNLITKRPFRGLNYWLLNGLGYERNAFLTWEQIKSLGGSVLKGEKGHLVTFWKHRTKEGEEFDADGNPRMIQQLQYYFVFNVAQCRDLPEQCQLTVSPCKVLFRPLKKCEAIITAMPVCPTIVHAQTDAYYSPTEDIVYMPQKKTFVSPESYYATLFHELVHSTGATHRVGRLLPTDLELPSSYQYSLEELIAELGCAYLCNHAGILQVEIDNSASYLKSWMDVFKGDTSFIIAASVEAQKAVDFILHPGLIKK